MKHSFTKKKAVLLTMLILLLVSFSSLGRSIYLATIFSIEYLPSAKMRPVYFLTQKALKEELLIESQGRIIKTDIWRPNDEKRHPSVIIAAGVDLPKSHPVVSRFANSLARIGYVAIVPEIEALLQTRYKPEEAKDFVNIFNFMINNKNVDDSRLGFVGFCLGSSVVLIAAQDQMIAKEVSFVSVAALLYDLQTLSRDAMAETVFEASHPYKWIPDPKTKFVIVNEFVNFIQSENEQQVLKSSLLENNPLPEDEFNNLSPDAKSIYSYLSNKDIEKFQNLWENLPEEGKKRLAKLSPKSNIQNLKAKTFIIPGNQKYLPKTEAENLARSLPKNQVVFSEIEAFAHTELSLGESFLEKVMRSFQLISHLTKFILYTKPFAPLNS